jgi:hypothetical protein
MPGSSSHGVGHRLAALQRQLGGLGSPAAAPTAVPDTTSAAPPHGQAGPAVANNNVVVFFTDQQRFDTSALHGNPMGLTPNFDRIARRGTHLAEAVTCQPVCGPARSAFQTGMWPTATGCFRNNIALPPGGPKIGELFRAAGFRTGYIGKWCARVVLWSCGGLCVRQDVAWSLLCAAQAHVQPRR